VASALTKNSSTGTSVAVAACEQCGGNRVPQVHPVQSLSAWLNTIDPRATTTPGLLLSLRPQSQRLSAMPFAPALRLLSGPEGGLSPAEENAALAAGLTPATLGPRVLRAETAALAALAALLV
jgi:16S rRNA (uracil1498-N3)-methyltransferase